jgi:hypothetical protein
MALVTAAERPYVYIDCKGANANRPPTNTQLINHGQWGRARECRAFSSPSNRLSRYGDLGDGLVQNARPSMRCC